MKQLKHDYDQYLNNFMLDFKDFKMQVGDLKLDKDDNLGVRIDYIEPNSVFYEEYKYTDSTLAYTVTNIFIKIKDIDYISLSYNGFTEIGAVYMKNLDRYVISEQQYNILAKIIFVYFKLCRKSARVKLSKSYWLSNIFTCKNVSTLL